MRHRKKVKKLGRTVSHRKALLRNIAAALIEHHQIKTTLAKAKAAQRYIERLITYGKNDTVHSRRLAFKFLQNRTLVKKLFDEIAPTYENRNGGYTRVIKLGQRQGDGAHVAILQLVGFEELIIDEGAGKKKKKKPAKKAETKPKEKKTADKKAKKEKAEVAEETPDVAEAPKEKPAKKAPKAEKAEKAPEAEAEATEEKPAEAEEAPAEEKKEKAKPKAKPKKKAAKEEKAEEEPPAEEEKKDEDTGDEK
ncbi:MAG: 50S ribosomal protein L17 [Calditrichaeota bacterium]|nr:MAG: 50S ribosomal protein L17 [Calditrichota bacterium]